MRKEIKKPELKPCPFCGSTQILFKPLQANWGEIMCGGCFSTSGAYQTVEEAVEAWNKRVSEENRGQ